MLQRTVMHYPQPETTAARIFKSLKRCVQKPLKPHAFLCSIELNNHWP